jgi:hypothetical protein
MLIRRLNEAGIRQLEEFLNSLTSENPITYTRDILINPTTSEDTGVSIEIETRKFANRLEAAEYLHTKLSVTSLLNIESDKGLWAWLALFYFNQLCPPDREGNRKPGDLARWIPDTGNFRKYYRHLLAGPYRIYRMYRDNPSLSMILLCQPVFKPGDIVEQIASRQELITNKAVVAAATKLYLDSDSNRPRTGASGKGNGSARRLVDILNQFDVNWDLYSMSSSEIISMLPSEFSKFKPL